MKIQTIKWKSMDCAWKKVEKWASISYRYDTYMFKVRFLGHKKKKIKK